MILLLYFDKLSKIYNRGFKQSFQPGINVTKALTPALFYWHENTKKMFVVLNTTFWQQLLSNMLPFYAFLMLILAFLKPNLNYKIEHWKHHIFFGILKYNFWRLGFIKLTPGLAVLSSEIAFVVIILAKKTSTCFYLWNHRSCNRGGYPPPTLVSFTQKDETMQIAKNPKKIVRLTLLDALMCPKI